MLVAISLSKVDGKHTSKKVHTLHWSRVADYSLNLLFEAAMFKNVFKNNS